MAGGARRGAARLATAGGGGLEGGVVVLGRVVVVACGTPLGVGTLPANALPGDTPTERLLPHGSRLQDHCVLDVVYAGWPTPLARAFEEAGATVVSGFEMLVHQAAEQVRLMTGLIPPVEAMRAAGRIAMVSP